jgi:creatinine amidohydrolase
MHERANAVRDAVRKSLTPNPQSLSQAIRDGKRTFTEAGGPRAYFGSPAEATRQEGGQLIDALGSILAEAISAEI